MSVGQSGINTQVETLFDAAQKQAESEGIEFFPHQIEGVQWMLNIETNPTMVNGGILADDPGLGKTFQTAATAYANGKGGHLLFSVPMSVMDQWKVALRKFFPFEKAHIEVAHGPAKSRNFSTVGGLKHFSERLKEEGKILIVITSHGSLFTSVKDDFKVSYLHAISWERFVVDEVHYAKNPSSKLWKACCAIDAKYKWGLSGTPIHNKLDDLKAIYRLVGIPREAFGDMEALRKKYLLRRTRNIMADQYKELSSNIYSSEFDDRNQRFYNMVKKKVQQEYKEAESSDMDVNSLMTTVFELLMRLRQATIHPTIYLKSLLKKFSDNEELVEKIKEKMKDWEQYDEELEITKIIPSTKLAMLGEHIGNHTEDHKAIVVTHFREESRIVADYLENKCCVRVEIFDGTLSRKERGELVERAAAGDIDVLILQIMAGGVGLNLQMFNRVYFMGPNWNPANEIQAIARCHRIGQKSNVEVIKLIVNGKEPTIDERILNLQQKKRKIMQEHLNDPTLEFNDIIYGEVNLSRTDFEMLLK